MTAPERAVLASVAHSASRPLKRAREPSPAETRRCQARSAEQDGTTSPMLTIRQHVLRPAKPSQLFCGLRLGKAPNAYAWTVSNATRYAENSQNLIDTVAYREPLADNCPLDEAEKITSPRLVCRLVGGVPPTDDDFQSQRAANPNAQFNIFECWARGVSLFTNLSDAERQNRLRNLRAMSLAPPPTHLCQKQCPGQE